jgi:hypothetical protein
MEGVHDIFLGAYYFRHGYKTSGISHIHIIPVTKKSIIFSVVTKQLENTMYRIAKKKNERKGLHLA